MLPCLSKRSRELPLLLLSPNLVFPLPSPPPAPPSHLNLYLSSLLAPTTASPTLSPSLYHFRTTFVPNPFLPISLHLMHLRVFTKKHPGYVPPTLQKLPALDVTF